MPIEGYSDDYDSATPWDEIDGSDPLTTMWEGRVIAKEHPAWLPEETKCRIAQIFQAQQVRFEALKEAGTREHTHFNWSRGAPTLALASTPDLPLPKSIKNKVVKRFTEVKDHAADFLFARSERLPTLGDSSKGISIVGINGMDTTKAEAIAHQKYISDLILEESPIDFIYNHSHGSSIDALESIGNLFGFSPYTADLLREAWREFYEKNKDHPDKKLLQICHSQGTIHVYNALMGLPKEVADRVIVVSLAPAKIVPTSICYQSFNYASKSDIVHYGELMQTGLFETRETGISPRFEMILENRKELILLEPHPDAKGIDHGLQSLTFKEPLLRHLQIHISCRGVYEKIGS